MSDLTPAQRQQMEQMAKITNREAAPLDDKSFPTAVGMNGWPIDPTTEMHIKLPKPGEPATLGTLPLLHPSTQTPFTGIQAEQIMTFHIA